MSSRFFVGGTIVGAAVLAAALFWPTTWSVAGQPVRRPWVLPPHLANNADDLFKQSLIFRAGGRNWRLPAAALGLQVREVRPPLLWQRLHGQRTVEVTVDWDERRAQEALAPMWRALDRAPVGASWSIPVGNEPLQIVPDRPGQTVDFAALYTRVQAWAASGAPATIDVPLRALPASPTAAELAATGVDSLLATFTTYYDANVPRAENVAKAASLLDGHWWQPDEILSYNGLIGPIRAENGWQQAWVIVGNQLVPGVGGGACQVATTFYGAALLAGLAVIERHPHNLAVSYIDPSRDATVAPPLQDLKLRNTTGHPLYIRTQVHDGAVTFWLYGHGVPGRRIEVTSRVLAHIPIVEREKTEPTRRTGERAVLQEGHEGIVSEAVRLFYQNDVLLRTEQLSHDHYQMAPRVVVIGSGL